MVQSPPTQTAGSLLARPTPTTLPEPRVVGLQSTQNFRDLGGYPTLDGAATRHGLVYRSTSLSDLSAADKAVIRALGLAACIDLRSSFEVAASGPDDLGDPAVRVVRLPVLDVDDGGAYAEMLHVLLQRPRPGGSDLGALYAHMLSESAGVFARAFEVIATHFPSVHHCTAGKDRTGLLSALLLRVARVPDALIVWDWSRSVPLPATELAALRAKLGGLLEAKAAAGLQPGPQRPVRPCPPPAATPIEEALVYLDQRWAGAVGYLLASGVDADLIRDFRAAFAGDAPADVARRPSAPRGLRSAAPPPGRPTLAS
ncbi:MAG TPA: tyrosine-protein phosphatase [Egibacteraceae bacterium]|nr:tyrosine-protein phosphatase [Egibacteraceae bacterium]